MFNLGDIAQVGQTVKQFVEVGEKALSQILQNQIRLAERLDRIETLLKENRHDNGNSGQG